MHSRDVMCYDIHTYMYYVNMQGSYRRDVLCCFSDNHSILLHHDWKKVLCQVVYHAVRVMGGQVRGSEEK